MLFIVLMKTFVFFRNLKELHDFCQKIKLKVNVNQGQRDLQILIKYVFLSCLFISNL